MREKVKGHVSAGDSRAFNKTKNISLNIFLFFCSSLFTYFLAEIIFVNVFLYNLPLRLHGFLPSPFQILTQNSKEGLIPRNYIALVGDSYAVGMGDEYLTIDKNLNYSNYGTRGLLNKATGKDVVSFGQGGVGSLGGLVAKPVNYYKYLNATFFYKIRMPETIIVYFYENDINNNFQELNLRFIAQYGPGKIHNKELFEGFIRSEVLREDDIGKKAISFHWYDNLILYKFIYSSTGSLLKKAYNSFLTNTTNKNIEPKFKSTGINQVLVSGKIIPIPDRLQSPALELSEEEISLASYVFKYSLDYLCNFFANADVIVVYIPSPLSSYELSSQKVSIQTYHGRPGIYDARDVGKKSDLICEKIKKITEERQLIFIDTRDKIRSSAEKSIIHGPLDWKHFNKVGYVALCEAILSGLASHNNKDGFVFQTR